MAVAKKHASRRPTQAPQKKTADSRAHGASAAKAGPKKAGAVKAQAPKKAPEPARVEEDDTSAAAPAAPAIVKAQPAARKRVSAEQMSEQQREISISEFFTKNRHLLGFDNASRALLTSVKEAVDNSLDACEEAGILPEIKIVLEQKADNRFVMTVEDNGPGIVKAQVPKVFGKLLYGSKFHRLRQSRGQQGIGISAAGMYGQLTTGKPVVVTSKIGKGKPAYHYHLTIDTTANRPVIEHEDQFEWGDKDHGTSVSIEMEAVYKGGKKSVDEYVQLVAFANPHARIEYWAPGKNPVIYPRVSQELPPETKEIKPHPYGVELGMLLRMLQATKSRNLSGFLQSEFSRVSSQVAAEICKAAGLSPEASLKDVSQADVEKLYKGIAQTKIMAPPTNCLAPIGEAAMLEGLKALMVQQHIADEEAKARRKAEESAPKVGSEKAAAAAEAKVTQALGAITTLATADDDGGDADEPDEREVILGEDGQEQGSAGGAADAKGKGKGKSKAAKAVTSKKVAKAKDGGDADTDAGDNGNGAAPDTATEHVGRDGTLISIFGKPCFITAVTRHPRVYRGNPFQVEAALAWGGEMSAEELCTVVRLANRVPLLYQQGACAMTQSVVRTNWRSYDVEQSRGALPTGPLLVMVHIASVWVPFTSEAKEAVAHYDEIITELKFALQECGRRLSRHIRRRRRIADAEKKARYITSYIPHIGIALQNILGLTDKKRDEFVSELTTVLERSRKM